MVYIEPSTQIDIFAHAPVDRDLSNFLDFETETLRDVYYTSLKVISLNEHSYQRAGNNKIRVQVPTYKLQTCNYLRFKNVNFHERYFYAFITDINYINNITSEIIYEIDELQTWFYSLTFNECFIERQHVNDDTIGKWRFPENIEHSQYQYSVLAEPNNFDGSEIYGLEYEDTIIITAGYDKEMNTAHSGYLNSLWNTLEYNAFPNGVGVGDFINRVETEKQGGGIVACFDIPRRFGLTRLGELVNDQWLSQGGQYISYTFSKGVLDITEITGYGTPVNKKLLSYPYTYIMVRGSDGSHGEYHIEDFDGDECTFRETLSICNSPQSILTPMNYKGVWQNFNESILFTDFPQCSILTESYQTWLATEGKRQTTQLENLALTSFYNIASALRNKTDIGGTVVNAVNKINSLNTEREIASTLPPQSTRGSGNSLSYATDTNGFTFYRVTVRPEIAKIIDDYFSMYGYAIHQIAKPNLNGRKRWNFIQTANCSVSGAINSEVERKIENIFNSGVTIWHTPDNYRNYGVENPIV